MRGATSFRSVALGRRAPCLTTRPHARTHARVQLLRRSRGALRERGVNSQERRRRGQPAARCAEERPAACACLLLRRLLNSPPPPRNPPALCGTGAQRAFHEPRLRLRALRVRVCLSARLCASVSLRVCLRCTAAPRLQGAHGRTNAPPARVQARAYLAAARARGRAPRPSPGRRPRARRGAEAAAAAAATPLTRSRRAFSLPDAARPSPADWRPGRPRAQP